MVGAGVAVTEPCPDWADCAGSVACAGWDAGLFFFLEAGFSLFNVEQDEINRISRVRIVINL
jgi:hypothetical protein